MNIETYLNLRRQITELGFEEDIIWSENTKECASAEEFAREHTFVVANSIFFRLKRSSNPRLILADY